MKISDILKRLLQLLSLTVIMFISLAVSSSMLGIASSSESSQASIFPVLIFSFLNAAVMSLFIVNARLSRIKLIGISSLIFFGIQYFMTQIETLYFNNSINMPIEQVLRVIGSGALSSVIFCSLAVLILGKFKKGLPLAVKKASSSKSITAMCILSGIYVAIYFLFGYFIAWQFADIRLFYTESSNIVNLFTHLSNTMRDDTLLPLFQIFRGFLWAGIAFIIIHSLATRKILKYLVCPLLLGVLITSPLLLPNIYMPEMVRFGHSIELFTSMVLFGVISVFIDERI